MSDKNQVFKSFMEDALLKSLPEFRLTPAHESPPPPDLLHTSLAFEGQGLKATAFLSCSYGFLLKTCPLATEDDQERDAVLRDWLGELGNLTMGRLKNRLLAHSITIKIAPPAFPAAGPVPLAQNAGKTDLTNWYQVAGGMVVFRCRIEGEIPAIGEAVKQAAEILPGDAIYRLNETKDQAAKPSYDRVSQIRSGRSEADADDLEEGDDDLGDTESYFAPGKPKDSSLPTAKPTRILYHSQLNEPVLGGVSWPEVDKLVLKFSAGLDVTLSPRSLLAQGLSTFTVEGLTMALEKEGRLLRISFPRLHIHLSKMIDD